MPGHRAGQHRPLHIRTEANKIIDVVTVVDAHDVLFDDRSLIKIRGDVMRCRTNEFDAALPGSSIGRRPDEGRQERVMDVHHRAADLSQKIGGEDLHVSGQHHQIDIAAQQLELALLGLCADVLGGRNVDEGHPERPDLVSQVRVIGDHHRDRHLELAAAVSPQ